MTGARSGVGIVGAGNMGGALVERLCEAAWPVFVCDIDARARERAQQAGATVVAHSRELALKAKVVIVLVVDAAQVEQVLFDDGLAAALAPAGTVILCPTLGPAYVESVAERLGALCVQMIDAPVSGGPLRARQGAMSLMLAGDDAVIEAQADLLAAMSTQVFRLGSRIGDAARTKLVNNLVAAINLAGAAEGLALAGRWGLDLPRTLAVMEQSSAQSWIGSDRMRRALVDDYVPRAHTTLLAKDTRLACEAAASTLSAVPLGALAAELFARACNSGCAPLDDASLFALFSRD